MRYLAWVGRKDQSEGNVGIPPGKIALGALEPPTEEPVAGTLGSPEETEEEVQPLEVDWEPSIWASGVQCTGQGWWLFCLVCLFGG